MTVQATERGWVPDVSDFGARLALIRQYMGWGNVKEAAVACGLPVSSWRSWERDNRLPRDYRAICLAISQTTGCDLGWLMGAVAERELRQRQQVPRKNRRTERKCTPPWADHTGVAARPRPVMPVPGRLPLAKAS